MNNFHESITMSFLPVGHTKFSPDPAFGVFKSKFRRSDVNNLTELVGVVLDSTPDSELNDAKLVGDVAGNVFVPVFDWHLLFRELLFTNIPNIKTYHKFFFSQDFKGTVRLYESSYSSDFTEFVVAPKCFSANIPPTVSPLGLSAQRKSYLFNSIRQFVAENSKDILCPKPVDPDTLCTGFKEPEELLPSQSSTPAIEVTHTLVRASPKCGFCGHFGHRNSYQGQIYLPST
jgi:hypothetical protein